MQRPSAVTVALISSLLIAAAASAAPCTTTKADCTEWITFSGGPSRSLIYRTYPLDQKNEAITRALIMVHGAGRDATTTSAPRWPRPFSPARSTTRS